jgi:hypothetical protein
MTINHFFLHISHRQFAAARTFYATALESLGYKEMMYPRDDLVAFGTDFPYLWLKRLSESQEPLPTHIAFDAPS